MVTRKAATKVAVLKFNPKWIADPPPPFFKNLNAATRRELTAAKRDFSAKVQEILAKGQQR